MENKGLVLDINCENAELKDRYSELEQKMSEDKTFAERCKACKNIEELYLAYKDFGYTDLELADFGTQFIQLVNSFPASEEDVQELKTEDLEKVVGGLLGSLLGRFSLTSLVSKIYNKLPDFGPIIGGVAKFIRDRNSVSSEVDAKENGMSQNLSITRMIPEIIISESFK